MNDNNKFEIMLEHTLDQLKAAQEPIHNQLINQATAIRQAMNDVAETDETNMTLLIAGKQYDLSLRHADTFQIIDDMLQNLIDFAKSEIE